MRLPLFLLLIWIGSAGMPVEAAETPAPASDGAAAVPESPPPPEVDYAALAANAERLGDLPNAAMLLERARSGADDRSWRQLTLKLIELQIRLKAFQEAERLIGEMAERFPIDESTSRRILEGRLLFATGGYSEAEALCRELRGLGNSLSLEQLAMVLTLQADAELAAGKYAAAAATCAELGNLALPREKKFAALVRQIYALLLAGEAAAGRELLAAAAPYDRVEEQLTLKKLELLELALAGDIPSFLAEYPQVAAALSPDQADYLMMQAAWRAADALQKNGRPENVIRAAELLRDAYRFAASREEQKDILLEFANVATLAGMELAAAAALESYLAAYPDDEATSRLLMEAGLLHAAAGKYPEALRDFRRLTSRTDLPAEVRLAAAAESVVVARQANLPEEENRNLAYLIRHARNAQERQDAYFLAGESQFRWEEYEKAAESFAAAAAEPGGKRETAVYWQLQSLIRAERFQDGLEVVAQLRDSESPELRHEAEFFTALLLEKTGDAAGAMQGYLELAQRHPETELAPLALFNAGILAEREQNFPEAVRIFSDFGEKYPENPHAANAWFKAAQAAFLIPDETAMQKATEALRARYRNSPYAFAALFLQADLQAAKSHFSEALETLDLIARLAENQPEILARCRFDAAGIHLRLDAPAKARALLAELLEENISSPLAADAARLAGDIAVNAGRYRDGAELYRRAAELRPGDSDTYFARACLESAADCERNLFLELREPELLKKAMAVYRRLIDDSGTPPAAVYACRYKLGLCLELEENQAEALKIYGEILHRAIADREKGNPIPAVWIGKAAYAAVRILQQERRPEAGRQALNLIELYRLLDLETGEDFDAIIERIRARYRI